MKHISPTSMHSIPMRLTTFTKTLPQMSFHLYFLLFLFRSGAPPMTLLTAGALTAPRLPATASNVCTTDARLGGQTKTLARPVVYRLVVPIRRSCCFLQMVRNHAKCMIHRSRSLNKLSVKLSVASCVCNSTYSVLMYKSRQPESPIMFAMHIAKLKEEMKRLHKQASIPSTHITPYTQIVHRAPIVTITLLSLL